MSTLASNDSTISEEVPIEYENKVAIHDATENYYEGRIHACRSCNNIKFPLYVLKVLKLYLFCLPMLVDSCSYKLCAHKIPRHRKWVRFKCASHILQNALFVFQFLSIMWASLKSSCLAKGIKEKRLLGDNPTLLSTIFVFSHDYATVVIMFYSFCFNKVPSKTFGKTWVKVNVILL